MVETDFVEGQLSSASPVVVDVRKPQHFLRAHLPGAVNLPEFFLKGPQGAPEPAQFSILLGKLGIARESHVIAYDDGASPAAARLFWVLSHFGHGAVSVLNGGIGKWLAEHRPVSAELSSRAPVTYDDISRDNSVLATMADVLELAGEPTGVIVDTRDPAEYRGWQVSTARNGHIPGAINIDWLENLERGEDGAVRLRTNRELSSLYSSRGVTPDKQIVVHCQSGSRACETFLVLKALGYRRVALYSRGWSEWGNQTHTPIEEE